MAISAHAQAHLDAIRRSTEEQRPTSPEQPQQGQKATYMDNITIEPEINKRDVHPPGPHGAVCVDIIDLGMRYNDKFNKASQACALVFKTTKGMELSREFSVSMNEKAGLRKFLEAWRGAKFTPEELGAKLTLKAFGGKSAMVSIQHNTSKDGQKVYANIDAIMPLPDGMPLPDTSGYKRAPFWEERKKKYSDEFAAYMSRPPSDPVMEAPF